MITEPLIINITYQPDPELSLTDDEMSIESNISISLLEALEGTTKKVRTIRGIYDLTIPPLSKHNQIIEKTEQGIDKSPHSFGSHFFTFNIDYPPGPTLQKLIETLKESTN